MRQKPHLHSVRMGQCVLVCSVYQMFIPLGLTQWGSTIKMLRTEKNVYSLLLAGCKGTICIYCCPRRPRKLPPRWVSVVSKQSPYPFESQKDNMPKLHLRSIYRNTVALCPLFFPTTPWGGSLCCIKHTSRPLSTHIDTHKPSPSHKAMVTMEGVGLTKQSHLTQNRQMISEYGPIQQSPTFEDTKLV